MLLLLNEATRHSDSGAIRSCSGRVGAAVLRVEDGACAHAQSSGGSVHSSGCSKTSRWRTRVPGCVAPEGPAERHRMMRRTLGGGVRSGQPRTACSAAAQGALHRFRLGVGGVRLASWLSTATGTSPRLVPAHAGAPPACVLRLAGAVQVLHARRVPVQERRVPLLPRHGRGAQLHVRAVPPEGEDAETHRDAGALHTSCCC